MAYTWVSSHTGAPLPNDAVQGGVDSDFSTIYVGLASHNGHELPCKGMFIYAVLIEWVLTMVLWVPTQKLLPWPFLTYGWKLLLTWTFQILCAKGPLHWISTQGGVIPDGAIPSGRTRTGEILYVGRAMHNNTQIIGKVHPSYRCLYIPYGGKEHCYMDYEVLVDHC